MRRPILALALAVSALVPVGHALAAPGDLTVGFNESRYIPLRGEATTVVVGDPKVADVSMTNAHSVIVIGKGYGMTRLLVTDVHGRALLDDRISVVDGNDGRVTFYRGVAASDYVCAGGRCHGMDETGSGGGGDSTAPAMASDSGGAAPSGNLNPIAPSSGSTPIQPSPGVP